MNEPYMDEQEMKTRVTAILAEYTSVPAAGIREDSRLGGDLGLSSLDLLNLLARYEEEFGITADDRNLPDLQTVGDVLVFLKNAL